MWFLAAIGSIALGTATYFSGREFYLRSLVVDAWKDSGYLGPIPPDESGFFFLMAFCGFAALALGAFAFNEWAEEYW